jgi:hypothetical protein
VRVLLVPTLPMLPIRLTQTITEVTTDMRFSDPLNKASRKASYTSSFRPREERSRCKTHIRLSKEIRTLVAKGFEIPGKGLGKDLESAGSIRQHTSAYVRDLESAGKGFGRFT